MTKLLFALLAVSTLVASLAIAHDDAVAPPINADLVPGAKYVTPETRFDQAVLAYQSGRCSIGKVINANKCLFTASLHDPNNSTGNASVEYDVRATEIEHMAIRALKLGTGTETELKQAQAARLDAMLRPLLSFPVN